MGWLSRRLFGLSLDEVTFARRGFRGGRDPVLREHLENVGRSFLDGYHAAFEEGAGAGLRRRLDALEAPYRGFAWEGAAMSLMMLDVLVPRFPTSPSRWRIFLESGGSDHVYMAHVGAGWAIARLPFGMGRILGRLDPLLVWLAYDGWGFHQGFFDWRRSVEPPHAVPSRAKGYGRRAFDQGLGRSLWFVDGADVERLPATIARFPEARRADLWSGVGLASTYAGGVDDEALRWLFNAANGFHGHLLQGASFAAKARQRAGNPVPHTEAACRLFGGISAEAAAAVSDTALEALPEDGELPAYELWRRRIRVRLSNPGEASP